MGALGSPDEIEEVIAQASRRRRMMTADGVAGLLMVTIAERTRLKLKTIGACDISKAERGKIAKERKRERDRSRQEQRRRAAGRKDRKSYAGQSLSTLKPWEAVGMSRATWYRQRETRVSRIDINRKGDTPESHRRRSMHSPRARRVTHAMSDASPSPVPPSLPSTVGEAGRVGVRGMIPRRGCQGAGPHGSGDKSSEEAA